MKGFQKGASGNATGRPKGKKKSSAPIWIEGLLNKNREAIEKELEVAPVPEKVDMLLNLASLAKQIN